MTGKPGRSGTVRSDDPDLYCTRPACRNYHVKGSPLCRIHGANRAVATRRVAAAALAREAGAAALKPEDFPQAVTEIVGWQLGMVRSLQAEMEALSIIGSPIELAREYEDILRRLDASANSVAKLMGAVAALGIADAFKLQAQVMSETERANRVNRLFAVTLEAAPTGPMWTCPTCGRGCCTKADRDVVDADVVA